MSPSCAILAAEVVTSLGASLDETWVRMLSRTCGIRPMKRFPHGRYRGDYAGEIDTAVEEAIRGQAGLRDLNRAALLAMHVGKRVLDAVGRPRNSGLVLASTKANVCEIDSAVHQPGAKLAGHWNPAALSQWLASSLGLSGPVLAVSNACASGIAAIVCASQLLLRGECDLMLVIGVDVLSDFVLSGFSRLNAISPQPCRPYDVGRDGLSLGEGAGALVLARHATRDRALGYVRGWGMTNDAEHITKPSPTGRGMKLAIESALRSAGLTAADVQYVNGHGTATTQNDDMEAEAIHAAFGSAQPPVSSMKGYFGHTLGAAGVIEAALCLKAMRDNTAPASLGLTSPGLPKPLNPIRDHRSMTDLVNVLTLKAGFGGFNAALALSKVPQT